MTIYIDELIEFLAKLCENKKIMVTATQSLKAGAIVGISSAVGGLLLGPLGIAMGAVISGVGSAISAKDKFQPLAKVLRDMSKAEKKRLSDSLVRAFRDFGINDIIGLYMFLMQSPTMQDMAIKQLTSFVTQKMHMKICS